MRNQIIHSRVEAKNKTLKSYKTKIEPDKCKGCQEGNYRMLIAGRDTGREVETFKSQQNPELNDVA